MGHQIKDMLLECSFAGGKCYPENFTHFYSNNYGNCYTLQHEKFISRTSGPSGGLELVLHLETEEYVPYFTTNNGIRVVVHEPNSLPFPDENGLSVMPGTNTFIGIKQVNVTRLPTKYDNCSNDDYNQIYNFAYTLYTCQSICEYNRIRDECNCSSNANREIQNVLKTDNDTHCRNNKTDCVRTKHFERDTSQCDCKNPCKETLYQEVISSTKWPTAEYATVFSIPICHVKNLTCGFAGEKLIQEFVKLNIFYQDLNHQVIVEKADYEIYQLFSDIGGTLGLWIGISVLGIFEVVHLIIRVAVFLITGRCAQTKPK
ncbi:FMRFamide-activated amiloride-sensitive sodium channel-like [Physella acuta]|uniref:FMRFamide-activated amiloride-sensitive sodium channel-like n=1 Tax=Physella acuta TaxID=109671 RepID=UPI0027DD2E88|nr:FMRFamide-activated amiloride-sensitive sodium channel-like [Physella acuta]